MAVAILGVATTLVTLILDRKPELALLRWTGAEQRQIRKMVIIEATALGAVSQGLGVVAGVLISLILVFVINVQSFGWTIQFHLPAGFLVQSVTADPAGHGPLGHLSRLPGRSDKTGPARLRVKERESCSLCASDRVSQAGQDAAPIPGSVPR